MEKDELNAHLSEIIRNYELPEGTRIGAARVLSQLLATEKPETEQPKTIEEVREETKKLFFSNKPTAA